MLRHWDAQTIASEILRRYNAKQPLNYTGVAAEYLSLLRAATRYFGTWEAAITFAGLDYAEIRLYKVWTRSRIVARIREHWNKGEDLSWRHVSMTLDPQLAGAATKKKHFGSWSRALEAAGLDYDLISRYIRWSDERILEKVREFHLGGRKMNAKKMEAEEIALLTAARRRFGSWPQALQLAGLQAREIVLRASFKGHKIFLPPTARGKRSPSRDDLDGAPVETANGRAKTATTKNLKVNALPNGTTPDNATPSGAASNASTLNASTLNGSEKKSTAKPLPKTLVKSEKASAPSKGKAVTAKNSPQPSLFEEKKSSATKPGKTASIKVVPTRSASAQIAPNKVPTKTKAASTLAQTKPNVVQTRVAPIATKTQKTAPPKAATKAKTPVAGTAKTTAAKTVVVQAPTKNKLASLQATVESVASKTDKTKSAKVADAKTTNQKPTASKAKAASNAAAKPVAKTQSNAAAKSVISKSAVKNQPTKTAIQKTKAVQSAATPKSAAPKAAVPKVAAPKTVSRSQAASRSGAAKRK